jgi:hypothetical protein
MFLFDILLTDMQAYEAVRWAIDSIYPSSMHVTILNILLVIVFSK